MSLAPFVMLKVECAFARTNAIYDSTIGWRFINKLMKEKYGVDSTPDTAEYVTTDYKIERDAQDRMALASQRNAVAAQQACHLAREIVPVIIPQKKGNPVIGNQDGPGTTCRPGFPVHPYSWDAQAMKVDIPSGPVDVSPFSTDTIMAIKTATAQLVEQFGRLRWSKVGCDVFHDYLLLFIYTASCQT